MAGRLEVDGYIRKIQKCLYPLIVPPAINELIFLYYDRADCVDEFDDQRRYNELILKGNTVKFGSSHEYYGSSGSILLRKLASAPNRYEWSFRIKKLAPKPWCCVIGVVNDDSFYYLIGGDWYGQDASSDYEPKGYGFAVTAASLTNFDSYGVRCKAKDVIVMHLDLYRCELSYSINGKHYGVAFKVPNAKYRAAVQLTSDYKKNTAVSYIPQR